MRKPFCIKASAIALAACLSVLGSACDKKAGGTQADVSNSRELAELTKQVRRYSFEKRKLPQTVEDLVTAGYVQSVPTAPTGKKYAIDADRAQVILVDR